MEVGVGKDVFAICGKCDATWHVIVAMEGARVAKVQCKQCMGYHRYRVPPGEVDINKSTGRRLIAPARGRGGTGGVRRIGPVSTPLLQPDPDRPVRSYTMKETYEPGDRIEHPKFGEGLVESVPAPGKMCVFFEDGRRTLAQGRAPSPA